LPARLAFFSGPFCEQCFRLFVDVLNAGGVNFGSVAFCLILGFWNSGFLWFEELGVFASVGMLF
jgi:hypothetical protein